MIVNVNSENIKMKYQTFLNAYKKETDSKLNSKCVKKCSQMS